MAQTDRIEISISSEQALANTYKEELDTKIRELCAIMNTAIDDGFSTQFQIGNKKDGQYFLASLALTKRF